MVAVPEMTEDVGPMFTVMVADPLLPVPAQLLAPVTETKLYVLLAEGLTEMFAPDT